MNVIKRGHSLEINVSEMTQPSRYKLLDFLYSNCRELDYMNRDEFGRPVIKEDYFIHTGAKFYIHSGFEKELKSYMEGFGFVWREGSSSPTPNPRTVSLVVKPTIQLRDYQKLAISTLEKNCKADMYLIGLEPGRGKALWNQEPIPTPTGHVPMGKIKVGDLVIGSDGMPTKVEEVHPQPRQLLSKITFIDGTVSICSIDHLWNVIDTRRKDITLCLSVRQMLEEGYYTTENGGVDDTSKVIPKYGIPTHTGWEGGHTHRLLADPHWVGETLGDIGHYHEESIPDEYLYACKENRVLLYQGLLDSDEQTKNSGDEVFSTPSPTLVRDFLTLGRSLGKVVSVQTDHPTHTCKDDTGCGRKHYRIVEHKDCAYKSITSIKPAFIGESTCIKVAAKDSLFMTKGYNLTHNTFTSLVYLSKYNTPILLLARAGYLDQWEEEVRVVYDVDEGDVKTITGSAKLLDLAEKGSTAKFLLVSITTYTLYIKRWKKDPENVLPPWELLPKLGVGSLLIDETDENLRAYYDALMLSTYQQGAGLSGTFDLSSGPVVKRVQSKMYPSECRYSEGHLEPYRYYVKIHYYHQNPHLVRYSVRYRSTYSQSAYEIWIMKYPAILKRYTDMIMEHVKELHVDRALKGDKLLLLFGSIDMCKHMAEEIVLRFGINAVHFKAGMKKNKLYEADAITATPAKAGRALDIPGLITVGRGATVGREETDRQNFGRLRRPTNAPKESYRKGYIDSRERLFIQFNCEDVPAHKLYQQKRNLYLATSIKKVKTVLHKVSI